MMKKNTGMVVHRVLINFVLAVMKDTTHTHTHTVERETERERGL